MDSIWEIRTEGISTFYAACDDRRIDLWQGAAPLGPHRLDISQHRSTQIHDFQLIVDGAVIPVKIRSTGVSEGVSDTPEVEVEMLVNGYSVSYREIGKVTYRTAGKSKLIECSGFQSQAWEEAMVWLVGVLAVIRFPNQMD